MHFRLQTAAIRKHSVVCRSLRQSSPYCPFQIKYLRLPFDSAVINGDKNKTNVNVFAHKQRARASSAQRERAIIYLCIQNIYNTFAPSPSSPTWIWRDRTRPRVYRHFIACFAIAMQPCKHTVNHWAVIWQLSGLAVYVKGCCWGRARALASGS